MSARATGMTKSRLLVTLFFVLLGCAVMIFREYKVLPSFQSFVVGDRNEDAAVGTFGAQNTVPSEKNCGVIVEDHSNQLVCNMMYLLWESFPAPQNASTHAENRFLPNLIKRNTTITKDEIVLATHLAVPKLSVLLIQVRWWAGPVSASVLVKSAEEIDTFLKFTQQHAFAFRKTSFHIVLEKTNLPYPHNILRNLALDYLDGDYFVALDVDFITNPNAHPKLVNLFATNKQFRERLLSKIVFVLPAFERFMANSTTEVTEEMLPRTKKELTDMYWGKKIGGFHTKGFKGGHGPTDFERWLKNKTDDIYDIRYKNGFEPYVMGYRPGIPRLWPHFRGFGGNKISWLVEIDKAGYWFGVLRDFWVCHMNHLLLSQRKKNEMAKWNSGNWKVFKAYLSKQYPRSNQWLDD